MTEQKLKELLADMTLEEKVNQMSQVVGAFFNKDMDITAMGPMADKGFTPENVALSGSILGSMGAETLKKIQKDFVEQHPHHIPMLFMLDVINGFKTIFPIPLGQGATFEPELSEKCAAVAAKEASVSGLHVTFAPMTDLVRDARWGRVMESTGEDPYLNGLFCAGMVRGFQGDDLKEPYKIASCVKHFAGYGAPTAGRDYNTVELSEHTFRDFYLPSYKAGIDAGAAMVMTSFNTVNGVPATGNKKLMRGILRDEMGFDGVLISDWAAIEEIIYHGYCADREEAAVRSAEAGVAVKASLTGYVKEVYVNEGDYVNAGQPLLTITRNRLLQLRADVPQKYYAALRNVSDANFRPAYSDETYSIKALGGRLVSAGRSAAGTFYIPAIFEFSNTGDFVPGSYSDIYLIGSREEGIISVPESALLEEQGVYSVFVKVCESEYRKQEVRTGRTDGLRREILSGINEGDEVVTAGTGQVRLASMSGAIPEGHSHNH